MNERNLLLSVMSQATARPGSSIGLTRNRANGTDRGTLSLRRRAWRGSVIGEALGA